MPDCFVVYILQSRTSGRFYIGHTNSLPDRIRRHNSGRTLAGKGKGPFEVVHAESFPTRAEAVSREREIKSKKRRRDIADLIRTSRA